MAALEVEVDSAHVPAAVCEQMLATVLGQCIGDALGLLTEFMSKEEAKEYYGRKPKNLKYAQKVPDLHRSRWKDGDWTDDTDQMILILQGILYNKGEVLTCDFAARMRRWMRQGFPELGDFGGNGIGATTSKVLNQEKFLETPHEVAYMVWDRNQRNVAPNGAVMRTSILGLHQWQDLDAVIKNCIEICKTTHHDPRCQASTIAVSTCIAQMLQHTAHKQTAKSGSLNVDSLIKKSYELACSVLETEEQKKELWMFQSCKKIKELELSGAGGIGYTYKCMGAGFWALKQDNFKKAMIQVVMQAGDADTNGCVAGAMLACKLGLSAIPKDWIDELEHKDWLMEYFHRFVRLQSELSKPVSERTSNDDLSLEALRELTQKIRDEQQKDSASKT
ncbi:ADP-ribosyl-[dinitrogen reductase] glycohydrolase [Aplysia californica]|uniref:ADP-ribosyl-[dinitrogen reductase] glycohydrolase n=1 Tax=Aplysia californica TaxID=6500 RepID=A0ABM0JJI8_APLCA|nr:ADP-ribosyl-[dinitrogen reductase] glycohydrolase [Aplysia californica]